jgi:phage shock protein PspC (stress-responsive transcriptional regulator)
MDKTININLGGTLFQIDEEAYRILRDYLQSIDIRFRNVPGGNETIEDIESRIAEIFQSQRGTAGVISKENVNEMIGIIGKPEDFDQIGTESRTQGPSFGHPGPRKRLFKNPENSVISGVCGGIGAYLNSDPVWVRILFIIFTCFFGFGLFVYLALWIALPTAETDSQKREMYGGQHNWAMPQEWDQHSGSKAGHVINEVFRAIGKVLFIIVRVFLIALGVCLVLTGFLALLTFVMVFIFQYPGAFSTDALGMNLSYLPDFLNYIITPHMVPWVKALIIMVVTLPLLAFIYGGIRMIFWFRARDGYIWLIGLVLWVMSAAALSIILFNEGIGFSETGKTSSREYFKESPDTLYIRSGMKISDIKVDKEITVPGEENEIVYISDEKKEIYFRPSLNIEADEGNSASVEIRKRSCGRSTLDAMKKSERLIYNSRISGKTVYLDEFFTIPADSKWSFDYVSATVHAPKGTIIYMDKTVEFLYYSHEADFVTDSKHRFWKITEDGPEYIQPGQNNK